MSKKRILPKIVGTDECEEPWPLSDRAEDIEELARGLCEYHGIDPDAKVFPGTPETIRTSFDRAYIIPKPELQIAAWQLFQSQAMAIIHLQKEGFIR